MVRSDDFVAQGEFETNIRLSDGRFTPGRRGDWDDDLAISKHGRHVEVRVEPTSKNRYSYYR